MAISRRRSKTHYRCAAAGTSTISMPIASSTRSSADGKPAITDQGSQFISFAFTNTLKDADIHISMDGRGRWMDNVFCGDR